MRGADVEVITRAQVAVSLHVTQTDASEMKQRCGSYCHAIIIADLHPQVISVLTILAGMRDEAVFGGGGWGGPWDGGAYVGVGVVTS